MASFVLPVGDSIPEFPDAVRQMAVIHQTGGGTGFCFSHLRPRGDPGEDRDDSSQRSFGTR